LTVLMPFSGTGIEFVHDEVTDIEYFVVRWAEVL